MLMADKTPKSMRLHIGLFGRRNVGKSSLLNALTRQQVSIVSECPGTTTDPVDKPMELLPLGPVLFIDTAGIDDEGALGQMRIAQTRRALDRTDLGVVVTAAGQWGPFEEQLCGELRAHGAAIVVASNKADLGTPSSTLRDHLGVLGHRLVVTDARAGHGIDELRAALLAAAPSELRESPTMLADLVGPGQLAVLVVPVDKEAPKGRLILPQAQAVRELLDHDAWSLVVKEHQLGAALAGLRRAPKLVVTDSQAFREVAALVPREVPMTSFSILLARMRGDLVAQTRGALAIDSLRPGSRVLVAEACSHHPIGEDIGRVKLPRWLQDKVGGTLQLDTVQGHDFPPELASYQLVVHCGACMLNRREVRARIARAQAAGVPITNYGLAIAHCFGILPRALEPFPEARAALGERVSAA